MKITQYTEAGHTHPILPGVKEFSFGESVFSHQREAWQCGYCVLSNAFSFALGERISTAEVKQGMESVLGYSIKNGT